MEDDVFFVSIDRALLFGLSRMNEVAVDYRFSVFRRDELIASCIGLDLCPYLIVRGVPPGPWEAPEIPRKRLTSLVTFYGLRE